MGSDFPFVLFAEPLSLWEGTLMFLGVAIAALVLTAAGGYVFVCMLASLINSRTRVWESAAVALGLEIDKYHSGKLYKSFVGNRDGYPIKVSHYGIPDGKRSIDAVEVEVTLRAPIPFTVQISKREFWYQRAAVQLNMADGVVGDEVLDRIFKIETDDLAALKKLLNGEIPGESPTLLNDLLHAAKNYSRTIITGGSVLIGEPINLGDADAISRLIKKAINLGVRIESAGAKSGT